VVVRDRSRKLDLSCANPNSTTVLPLLITGTGRSGTKHLASKLLDMGLDLPHVWIRSNPVTFFDVLEMQHVKRTASIDGFQTSTQNDES